MSIRFKQQKKIELTDNLPSLRSSVHSPRSHDGDQPRLWVDIESQRLLQLGSTPSQLSDAFASDDDELDRELSNASKTAATQRRKRVKRMNQIANIFALPWAGWAFVYAFTLFCFSVSRWFVLKPLAMMYGSPQDYTTSFKVAALSLGFLEDFVCTTYLVCALWLFDTFKISISNRLNSQGFVLVQFVWKLAPFTVSWMLFIVVMTAFAADVLLVLNHNMRFTFDLVATLIREKQHLGDAPISKEEFQRCYTVATLLMSTATVFALVRTWANWSDLAYWDPTLLLTSGKDFKRAKYKAVALEEGKSSSCVHGKLDFDRFIGTTVVLVGLVIVPMTVVALACASSSLVAYSALNATLNELFAHALQPAPTESTFTMQMGIYLPWMEMYIHPTERHKLYGNDSMYRLTTGFRGDVAFDVDISDDNPPNVLIIGVESFRFRDSRYFVGEEDPSGLFKGTDLVITPNFDRWAKRGVALQNLWTSIPTSRSLESVLFAQTPYDNPVKTGITGGRVDTNLSGLPQLFSSKGYDTFFSTGSSIDLDNWDTFLPSHGFDTVWDNTKITELAENHYNITPDQWEGNENRGFTWGVHDDVSFQVLGDLLINKTRNQTEQVSNGEPKTPLFITHYTITSHAPFNSVPTWYIKAKRPDFSALYAGEQHAKMIQRYLDVRYFTDMQLGKFLDRMDEEGILNNTIVVIYGDHGQAPEAKIIYTEEESVARVPGHILAEGRLGKYAGLKIEDPAEHYDILNTLADITREDSSRTGSDARLNAKLPLASMLSSAMSRDTRCLLCVATIVYATMA